VAKTEGETVGNLMQSMRAPHVPLQPVAVLSDEQLGTLMAMTRANGFEERRDAAILRLLIDTGMRKSELAGLRLTDVDHVQQVVFVRGRGNACARVHFEAGRRRPSDVTNAPGAATRTPTGPTIG